MAMDPALLPGLARGPLGTASLAGPPGERLDVTPGWPPSLHCVLRLASPSEAPRCRRPRPRGPAPHRAVRRCPRTFRPRGAPPGAAHRLRLLGAGGNVREMHDSGLELT